MRSLSYQGGVRLRYERWNWFEPGDFPAANDNNDYGFWGIVTNLKAKYKLDLLDAVLDIQDSRLLGLPEDANSPAPQGPLGHKR